MPMNQICQRCTGPLDSAGRSWIYAKPGKNHQAILSVCGRCSGASIDTCLMCKASPAMPGQAICAACDAAL